MMNLKQCLIPEEMASESRVAADTKANIGYDSDEIVQNKPANENELISLKDAHETQEALNQIKFVGKISPGHWNFNR